jgi:hypothetical protein
MPPENTPAVAPKATPEPTTATETVEVATFSRTHQRTTIESGAVLSTVVSQEPRSDVVIGGKA